jgi:hypothetical protein
MNELLALRAHLDAELGRDHHLITDGSERVPDQLLVRLGPVGLGRVEEGDAALDRRPDQRDHLLPVGDWAVGVAHTHAAEPEGGDLQALSEVALMHLRLLSRTRHELERGGTGLRLHDVIETRREVAVLRSVGVIDLAVELVIGAHQIDVPGDAPGLDVALVTLLNALYQAESGPLTERTYRSSPWRTTQIVLGRRRVHPAAARRPRARPHRRSW